VENNAEWCVVCGAATRGQRFRQPAAQRFRQQRLRNGSETQRAMLRRCRRYARRCQANNASREALCGEVRHARNAYVAMNQVRRVRSALAAPAYAQETTKPEKARRRAAAPGARAAVDPRPAPARRCTASVSAARQHVCRCLPYAGNRSTRRVASQTRKTSVAQTRGAVCQRAPQQRARVMPWRGAREKQARQRSASFHRS